MRALLLYCPPDSKDFQPNNFHLLTDFPAGRFATDGNLK
jgi:hypothetical protein